MAKRLIMLVAALMLMVSTNSAFAYCTQIISFSTSADSGCVCNNTGEWVGMFTGTHYCDYACSCGTVYLA